jgi:hypothetical protein
VRARWAVVVLAGALVAGCTGGSASEAGRTSSRVATSTAASSSPGDVIGNEQPVLLSSTLTCEHLIDGDPPPRGFSVVLGAVALPAAPGFAALQAAPTGNDPASGVFAKTGLLVRAGATARLDVPASAGDGAGIGWSGAPSAPSRTFVVPACPDLAGTGWLAFAGGYWADRPVCLPLDVTVGDQVQRVRIGIGTACPGQSPPPR